MGDLFDGYGSQKVERPRTGASPWDEMFADVAATSGPAGVRDSYRDIYSSLARMTQEELRGRTDALASSYLAQGVTFDFAGEERPFPLDAVPRVIESAEWNEVQSGIKQRVRALEAFLDDAYGRQYCVRDGVLPAQLIASSQYFYRQAAGIHSANGVRIHVSGIDLIRDEHGEMRVLEDNVRSPSGVAFGVAARALLDHVLPDLPRPAGLADPASPVARRAGSGTALANIRRRLEQTYGSGASLDIAAAEPRGVRARLSMPVTS